MRTFEKILKQTDFAQDFERRGMNGVAAEIAQKIRVFLEHGHGDSGTGQEKTKHHTRRSATHDAAASL
ncbi:MAG TPA: hypothetical protein VIY49_12155 [Bryobacteraceae bacterium]